MTAEQLIQVLKAGAERALEHVRADPDLCVHVGLTDELPIGSFRIAHDGVLIVATSSRGVDFDRPEDELPRESVIATWDCLLAEGAEYMRASVDEAVKCVETRIEGLTGATLTPKQN